MQKATMCIAQKFILHREILT